MATAEERARAKAAKADKQREKGLLLRKTRKTNKTGKQPRKGSK